VTQPGVSRQVQKLERELGVPLVVRRRGGVALTTAGEKVYAYAEETLERHEQLLSTLRTAPAPLAGELAIAASTTPGEFVVPGLVAAFRLAFPSIRARVAITDTATVLAELQQGTVALGFVGARMPKRGLRYEAVAEDEIVLAVPATHRFAGRDTIALAELVDERFVEREGGSGTLLSLRRMLAAAGRRLPRCQVVMELSTTQAVISAVEGGHGVGWVSSLALVGRDRKRVEAVRLEELTLRRPLYLVTTREGVAKPVAAEFVAWVRDGRRESVAVGPCARNPGTQSVAVEE
jgi:DNA-binding transcriptional LysR family regulator